MPERATQEMKNHLNSWREKFVHALFRHTCTLTACRNGEEKKQDVLQRVKVIGKNDFTLTKTVTILFVHERGTSVHASGGYAARSVPEFPRSWTNNIVTITSWIRRKSWSAMWAVVTLMFFLDFRQPIVPSTQKRKVPPTQNQTRDLQMSSFTTVLSSTNWAIGRYPCLLSEVFVG